MKKITFYTRWGDGLECACYIKNPLCDKYKECEELELELHVFKNIPEVMNDRKYRKEGGVIKQY